MKYELVKTDTKEIEGTTLYRIRALTAIRYSVSPGDLGGYIQSEKNLSQENNAWVFNNACVSDNACVYDNACMSDNARMSGNAWMSDNARMFGNARMSGDAWMSGDACVSNRTQWILVGPAKSSGRFTTAFKDAKLGVRVVCGCFTGTVKEFSEAIENRHKDNKESLEQYRLFCQLIAFNFGVKK